MNDFIKEFNELVFLSTGFCPGSKSLVSLDDFVRRLKDFNDKYKGNYGDDSLLNLKLRLLCHLTLIMRNIRKIDDKCVVVNCMTNVIRMSVMDDIELFIHLYNSVFYEIYKEDNVKLSEEMKLAVLECSSELIKRCTMRLLNLLYTEKYGAKFSMGVLIAVEIAKDERSFKLRATSLEFLLCAMQHHNKNDEVLQIKVGNLFMFYLPGVIGRLEDIILREETQQHLITVKAITCWGQLLSTVMQDIAEKNELSDEDQIKIWMNLNKNGGIKNVDVKGALQGKVRDKRWLEAAAQTIQPLILKITKMRRHSHPKVRLELITQVSHIMDNCLMTLKNCVNFMIEIVISSSEDENEQVREAGELALAKFEMRCRSQDGQIYLDFIEEHLHSIINKLPNVIHLQDDKSILSMMESFCGDVKILGNSRKLGRIISFSSNLTRLVRVLLLCLRLTLQPEISLQDYCVWDSDLGSIWTKDWKLFKHFADYKIMRKLTEICHIIGSDDDIETVLDYLFDLLKEDNSYRNEILLLTNLIVDGSSNIRDNIVKQFLSLYLNPDYLYLPLQVDEDECTSIQQSRANIITVALIMEGIGKLSKVMGKSFEDYLLRSLYFIVEKMGSSYAVIRMSAVTTAVQISESVGLGGDVGLLIQRNIDYLTYHITIKLRRENDGVFDVITVLMKNSPFEAITNLEDIINNVLKTSSEKFDSPRTICYLRLFQTFVRCVNKWMTDAGTEHQERSEIEKTDVDLLLEYIQEREDAKREIPDDETNEENDEGGGGCDDEDEAEKEAKNLPKHIRLTVCVAENALNYLPSNNFDKKLLVLEILNESVSILANWENELLPIVHKIWSPLVTRFQHSHDPLLINRSFTLLCNMSRTSKDFIRRRTLMNVLPTLRNFLLNSANKSRLKDSGTGYHFTQEFKLQKELLNNLGLLATDLGLSVRELDMILESCLPYLSSFQPLPFQESCRKLFADVGNYDPYVVWYKLQGLTNDCEYSKNVAILLDFTASSRG